MDMKAIEWLTTVWFTTDVLESLAVIVAAVYIIRYAKRGLKG